MFTVLAFVGEAGNVYVVSDSSGFDSFWIIASVIGMCQIERCPYKSTKHSFTPSNHLA